MADCARVAAVSGGVVGVRVRVGVCSETVWRNSFTASVRVEYLLLGYVWSANFTGRPERRTEETQPQSEGGQSAPAWERPVREWRLRG